jgi:hypothetical protein
VVSPVGRLLALGLMTILGFVKCADGSGATAASWHEWPLMIFTVFGQCVVGGFIVLALALLKGNLNATRFRELNARIGEPRCSVEAINPIPISTHRPNML